MAVKPGVDLVDREAELRRLDEFVASVRTGACAAVLSGDAGIGKTAVWRLACDHAAAAGMRVLVTRCAEAEMPLAFGGLADLIGEAAGDLGDELPGQQRQALAVAFGHGEADHAGPDWLALARAVLATLHGLTRRGAVLVAVDDVQWLDPGSRRVMTYALRRLGDVPIGLLATVRGGQQASDVLGLAESVAPHRMISVPLSPLSLGAIQHLVSVRLGMHLPRPTAARVHRASGGNPMFALEFGRTALAEPPGTRAAPMSVPASLDKLVQARIGQVEGPVRELLEFAALLDRPTLPVLASVLGGDATAAELLDEAVRADLVVVAEDGLIRFTHPLLASGVYFRIGPGRRRGLHRKLARIAGDTQARGRHVALGATGPDAAAAELVEQAAAVAASRCALDAAAELIAEAARLTPADDAENHRRRLLACVGWLVETGEFSAARARLEPLLAAEIPAPVRGDALLLRAECEFADRRVLVGLLREALAVADKPRSRWQALIRLAHHGGWVSGDAEMAARTAREALDTARTLDDGLLAAYSVAAYAFYQAARGRPRAVPEATGSQRREPPPRMQWWQISPAISRGCQLLWAGDLEGARRILRDECESLSRSGRETRAGFTLCWLSELEWRAGDWAQAEALAQEATEILGDINPTAFPRALLAASTGRADETYTIAQGVLAWCERSDERVAPPRFHWLLGLLELSRGDVERASRSLATAQDLLDAAGIREPGYLPVLPDLAESLVARGKLDQAEAAANRLDKNAADNRHTWAGLAALRTRALISLGRGETQAACQMSDQAVAQYLGSGMLFEQGRALLLAGQARRRAGQRTEAAQRLTDAIQIFRQLGARLWLERAEGEMRRARPRPGREHDRLTAAEERVAVLVADGRTNKEVAASLYTTVATVEAHLTRIYRKLGLRSRTELTRWITNGQPGRGWQESGFL